MAVKNSSVVKGIATERIAILYALANETHKTDPKLSAQYVKLIKQISRHYKIKLDKDVKRHICKKCGALLVPGKNLSIKIVSSKRFILYKCLDCGKEAKIPY
jgi:ribonuclease P protein subunit RPR2